MWARIESEERRIRSAIISARLFGRDPHGKASTAVGRWQWSSDWFHSGVQDINIYCRCEGMAWLARSAAGDELTALMVAFRSTSCLAGARGSRHRVGALPRADLRRHRLATDRRMVRHARSHRAVRSAAELVRDLPVFGGRVERFLHPFPEYADWRLERVSLAPHMPQDVREEIERRGSLVQDLNDLTGGR